MADKLKDMKKTTSDAVEIIRELGSPDVQNSLEKIRKTTESFEKTSARIERVTMELKNSGVLDEARETIKSAKNTISSVGDSKNIGETMDALKEMLRSISALIDELKLTVVESKGSGTIHNIEETIRETRSAFTEHK